VTHGRQHRYLRQWYAAVLGLVLGLSGARAVPAAEVLDEPIAIVGDRIVLRSEWETQMALYAMEVRRDVNDAGFRDSVGPAILEQMIDDQLVLIVAERDTLVSVTREEIEEALEDHIRSLRGRFGSDVEFRDALAREGLSERDLRIRYRRDVENQILKQKLIQRKLAQVAVSHGEVREFYEYYKDSLPVRPEGIKLAHILMPIDVSQAVVDSTRARLTGILEEIRGGLDFAAAARTYSTDPSAPQGGDLGWFRKGQMVPVFEDVAFTLNAGQISGVVRTSFGWHLIQCVERDAERVHARHIILTLMPTAADSAAVWARADSVARAAQAGADFCALAQEFSHDEESQKNCGELGWYPIAEMYEEFKIALRDAESGTITPPVATDFGWHILRVLERRPAHRLNLEDDWDGIKQIARQDKTNRILTGWLNEIRGQTYVDVRPLSGRITIGPDGK